jgi:hypothetical protein
MVALVMDMLILVEHNQVVLVAADLVQLVRVVLGHLDRETLVVMDLHLAHNMVPAVAVVRANLDLMEVVVLVVLVDMEYKYPQYSKIHHPHLPLLEVD